MFGRKDNDAVTAGASRPELIARRLQATGQRVAGDRGGRIANAVSEAIGCGRIDYCNDPNCPDCN